MRKKLAVTLAFMMIISCFGSLGSVMFAATGTTIKLVTQTPWMINDKGTLKSETELTVDNVSGPYDAWIRITVKGKPSYMEHIGTMTTGVNQVTVHVRELVHDQDAVTFAIFDNAAGKGMPLASETRPQKKIRHWKIYSAHDMHMDIGFTDHPENLKNKTWPSYINNAVQHIKATDSWAENDKFRYPLESSYLLYDSAWNAMNADQIENIKNYIKAGRMSYPSGYMNEAFEAMGAEELVRFNYFSERFLKDKVGAPSNKVVVKTDDPGLSWANVDAMAESGIKYVVFRPNGDSSGWDPDAYPKLFYVKGRVPGNKLLFFNSVHYGIDELGFRKKAEDVFADPDRKIFKKDYIDHVSSTILNYHHDKYLYDAILFDYTDGGDNAGITPQVMSNIRDLNARKDAQGRDYVFPQFINSTADDFFEDVEDDNDSEDSEDSEDYYPSKIPEFKGTLENFWNFGAASTSLETGINKVNHGKLPAAELFATMANFKVTGAKYPYENILNAYNNMILYDEHTWGAGPGGSAVDDLWRWKRNTAIAGNMAADQILKKSLSSLNSLIPTTGRTIVVYNHLSWNRSDVVKVNESELPPHYDIVDKQTKRPVKYQKLSDGSVAFVAEDVPGIGYKTFDVVSRTDDPTFASGVSIGDHTMENEYFKVTFDDTGSVASILDKRHHNKELIDSSAPYAANQFIYYNSVKQGHSVLSSGSVTSAQLSGKTGGVMGVMTSDGRTGVEKGVDRMRRNVILYDSLPRIDFVNEVVKAEAPDYSSQDEEGFFSFPFKVPDFMIRHEMPTGDVRPHVDSNIHNPANEQFYTSSTDHYTVNNWIDISNQSDHGITFSPVNAPIVQYGERRSFRFDRNYNTQNPWIYSYVFSNKWWTNFQKTQPGNVTFKYSMRSYSGSDWKAGRSDKFGMEAANELKASVISQAQTGSMSPVSSRLIPIDKDNVSLTAAKLSEANGEGIILRFNETTGADTFVNVDLSWFNPETVNETDLVENDKRPLILTKGTVTFNMKGHGWTTIRIKSGTKPRQATGVQAVFDGNGTQITWDQVNDPYLSFYEIFRGTDRGFIPGPGNYMASVSVNHYYDSQVKSGLSKSYYYKVRAVSRGAKGDFSSSAQAAEGTIADNAAPSAPQNLKFDYTYKNRASFSWEPSSDDVKVAGYKIYRNGQVYKDLPAVMQSDLDTSVLPAAGYEYYVKAFDQSGKLSEPSNTISFATAKQPPKENIASLAKVTASTQFPGFYPMHLVDGNLGTEWASEWERKPWIKLEWDRIKVINRIVLYDRPTHTDDVNRVKLTFSDGTSLDVSDIAKDGKPKEVVFPHKSVTWVRLDVVGDGSAIPGQDENPGLAEMEVYEENLAYRAVASASSEYDDTNAASNVRDGYVSSSAVPVDWRSDGETNPWVQLEWANSVKLNKLLIYDAADPAVNANAAKIVFSDGSTIDVTDIAKDGAEKVVDFPERSVTWVKIEVTGGEGVNVGLAEVKAFSNNSGISNGGILSDLKLSNGNLYPRFSSKVFQYTAMVGRAATSITVTPTVQDASDRIEVNGIEVSGGAPSQPIPLTGEQTPITVKVISGAGVENTYTINATLVDDSPILIPVAASAGSTFVGGAQKADNVINHSGMSGSDSLLDTHDNNGTADTMWHTAANPGDGAWILFDLGGTYPLHEMWIWNINQLGNTKRGFKNVKIEFSTDGTSWTELQGPGYPYVFAEADGSSASPATNLNDGSHTPVKFEGKQARYVKITADRTAGVGSWGDVYYGLSEVRFTAAGGN